MTATYAFTRDQLVEAIACLTVKVRTSGPAAGMINAESMADAILGALAAQPVEDDYAVIPPAREPATTGRVILRPAEGSRP